MLAPDATLIADVSLNPHVAGHHYADDVAAALPFRALSDAAPVADALRAAGFEHVRIDLSQDGGEYPEPCCTPGPANSAEPQNIS